MRLLSIILVLLGLTVAEAQIVIAPAVTYSSSEVEDSENTLVTDSDSIVLDVKAGYLHSSGLYLGANYSLDKPGDDDGFAVGPTIGFAHYTGFYALFTYYILAELERGNNGGEFTEGMGPQVDLGWVFPLTSVMSLGPQLTYKSITYDKFTPVGGAERSREVTRTEINPYISFWFHF